MTYSNNKKNFIVYDAEGFIAAICQYIPDKLFQMARYYGWLSDLQREIRVYIFVRVFL